MLSAIFFAVAASLFAHARAPECNYSGSWNTVDEFQLSTGYNSEANGLAESRRGIFAAGAARSGADASSAHWIVRKSIDGGSTWSTVDTFKYSSRNSTAHSVAIDPRTNHVYVAGSGLDEDFDHHWIVRKSVDGGRSWKTVQDFKGDDGYASAQSVAIDSRGAIYVTGAVNAGKPGASRWITQRSADGGASWKIVDEVVAPKSASGAAVVTTDSGRVYVGGHIIDAKSTTWTVRSSPDGISQWRTVDQFQLRGGRVSQVLGGAFQGSVAAGGRVAFVGFAKNSNSKTRWIVRKARANQPTRWWTADEYVSDRSRSETSAAAADFAPNGRLFVTGKIDVGGEYDLMHVRLGAANSDAVQGSPRLETEDATAGRAVLVLKNGDALIAGRVARGQERWIVRKLNCSGDADLKIVTSPPPEPKRKPAATRRYRSR